MKRSLKLFRLFLTLAVAGVVLWALWQKLGPRLQPLPETAIRPKPLDPALVRLGARELALVPLATRFDYPLGSPNGSLTYNARKFREESHLGDDLNGIGGENSDLGDPVFAAGAGLVVYSGVPGPGWGNMIILAHRVREQEGAGGEKIYQTVYAHLDKILVRPNQIVQRGEQVGTVGTAGGAYFAHLHFEVRGGAYVNPSVGYADVPLNRLSPEDFMARRRGAPDEQLNPAPFAGLIEVEIESTTK